MAISPGAGSQGQREKSNPELVNPSYDVYDHTGRTRVAIRGFIKYLVTYKPDKKEHSTELLNLEPEPLNPELRTLKGL